MKPISRRRRWLFRFILLLLPLLLIGALEVSLRLAGYGYDTSFFLRQKIGGEDYFVQNENFSLRFFPKEIVRNPNPVRFPVHKAPGTFRIFILGESAAMGDPAPSFAPSRYLEMLLQEKYPNRKFEVINVAFTAINSHVILPIARECAEHEGDLWIVYMGNNEMVGPFGAATVFGRQSPPLAYARLVTALQRLRIGQWFVERGRQVASHGQQPAAWGGMGMFLKNQITPDSPRKEPVYQNFQKNLDDIVSAGVRSGAKVLLNTVGVNLKDCPPFASLNESRLSAADCAQFDQLYLDGLTAMTHQEFNAATDFFVRAARLDTHSARLQFDWGQCLLAQTNVMDAQEHFQLACDADALPFRADSRINAAIRTARDRIGGGDLIVFDAANALAATSGAGICGNETFFEHVHFDFNARYQLGRAWAEQIESLLPKNSSPWITQASCDQALGLSEWNLAQALHYMVERMQLPPLSSQSGNDRRRDALDARISQLRTLMNASNAAVQRQLFVKLLEQRPEDFQLHENAAVFLEMTGDVPGATAEWLRYRDLMPHDSLGYFEVGRLLNAQARFAEAEPLLQISLGIRPSRTDAWLELGNARAMQKKYPEALASYAVALKKDPQNGQTYLRRGRVLAHLNRHPEAMESYRMAIRLNPADALSHHELAMELVSAGDATAAGGEFGEAARLSPNSVLMRFDYGVWLLQQKRWEEAHREFLAVIQIEPDNLRAQKNLVWLQARSRTTP